MINHWCLNFSGMVINHRHGMGYHIRWVVLQMWGGVLKPQGYPTGHPILIIYGNKPTVLGVPKLA